MPINILLTGFKPFPGAEVNPTARLMELFGRSPGPVPGVSIETLVLDTAYAACERQLAQAVERVDPDAILCFGLKLSTDELHLERVAINLDEAKIPDTTGDERRGNRIVADGPVGYWATLPIEAILGALTEKGFPAAPSNHAGTYVCNHVFYHALHLMKELQRDTRVGFIHVPPLPEQIREDSKAKKGMEMESLFEAACVCITTIAGQIDRTR